MMDEDEKYAHRVTLNQLEEINQKLMAIVVALFALLALAVATFFRH